MEESNSLHLAFVYRGTRENAEKFLAAQDQFFVEPEEDTAQGEVSDDNNVADNTGDNAAGNEPAEEQEVENTDGE